MWKRALVAAFIGMMLVGSGFGCARPQRQPETQQASPVEMGAAIARIAAQGNGAGDTAAVVFDNHALIAIQLNAAQPGGTDGQSLIGTLTQPSERDMTDPGKGPPETGNGPGGSTGIAPATPGGGISPGGSAAGGSPVRTQAVPNASGSPATDTGTNSPVASPGAMGYAPLDVFHRIANQVKSRFPVIDEVRFAYIPADARRVEAIAREIRNGSPVAAHHDELVQLYNRAAPAGTTQMQPMHPAPAQNPTGSPGPNSTPARP